MDTAVKSLSKSPRLNVQMWLKALRGIPRISKEEWDSLDIISRWLIATRSAVLVMTFTSAAIGGLLAYRAGQFDWLLWGCVVIGLLLAHAANNLFNDLIDYLKGVDRGNYFRAQYGPQPVEHGLLTVREQWLYAIVTLVLALIPGIYLVSVRGELVLQMLLLGLIFVIFYTWPLKYIGLGELTVIVVWGPLMIGGGYYVVTGNWDWNVVIAGMPYALGPTCVLFGKHIDKLESDKAKKIYTLPVILGERNARYAVLGMAVLQYVSVVYLVAIGFFSPAMLIVLFSLSTMPAVWKFYRAPKPLTKPDDYDANIWPLWFSAVIFMHNRRLGGLFLLGLLIDIALRKVL
ncbi:MAG: prenyltransferase [Chloroherpetonaceae bacterium]|nr:prenyltransferase [Chloroherpetonaceae bacterium]